MRLARIVVDEHWIEKGTVEEMDFEMDWFSRDGEMNWFD